MKRRRSYEPTLDLHHLQFDSYLEIESKIFHTIDQFLYPILQKSRTAGLPQQIKIIVGKGLNSTSQIEGKNPLRYYTEKYLFMLNIKFRSGSYVDGQEGVIVAEV